jgi:DNA-binding NtrC family response regulator
MRIIDLSGWFVAPREKDSSGFGDNMALEKKEAKILVVDDDQPLADHLVEYLLRLGYRAVPAYGGKEALECFGKENFHLVITDLMMPDIGGLEVLEAVKGMDRRAVVLVITGHGTIQSAVSAIKQGAYDFVPKPFKITELEVVVARAIRHHTLFRQLGCLQKAEHRAHDLCPFLDDSGDCPRSGM